MSRFCQDPLARLLQIIASKLAKIAERIQRLLDKLLEQFPEDTCPTEEELLKIIAKRNEITDGLNQLNNQLSVTINFGDKLQNILGPLVPAIRILKLAPIPNTFTTTGVTALISDVLNFLIDNSKKIEAIICGLSDVQNFGLDINSIISAKLKKLDDLIEKCVKEKDIPYEIVNDELNALSGDVVNQLQNQNNGEDGGSYKGFTFEILYDKTNDLVYPKRYAVARNRANIITLTSDSSFASNPKVLINELKFIIDTEGLEG